MQDDGNHKTQSSPRTDRARAGEDTSGSTTGDPSYSDLEQPGPRHPREDTGLPQASDQAGEGNPDPTSTDPHQRVQKPEDDESEARLQDGEGAGRPGRGIYSGP